jgi:hypothetical protein
MKEGPGRKKLPGFSIGTDIGDVARYHEMYVP